MRTKIENFKYLAFVPAALAYANGNAAKNTKPNIIFILADDMSYRDLSCYGQKRYKTPNIDELAARGIRFTEAYAAAPESAPSRCSLMTGLHTGHSAVRINSSARGQDYLYDSDLTIAEVLKTAGYNTGFTGKWGIGMQGTEGVPYKQGFDYSFGYYDQGEAHTYIPYYLFENENRIEYPENYGFNMKARYDHTDNNAPNTYDKDGNLYISELKDPYKFTYSARELENKTMEFLEKNNSKVTNKPFFLYFATPLPHGPVIVDNIGEMAQPDSISQISREWAAMVIKLDKFVGTIVKHLKETGQYDNTIIFFASDNGYSMCGYTDRGDGPNWPDDPWLENKGPFTGGKFSVLEGGLRIPFFVSWPAKFKPAVFSQPVWLPDFFPTAVELAGLNPKKYKTDGKSLLTLLRGEANKYVGHEYMYFSKAREQAVRIGAFKAYRKQPGAPISLYLIEDDTYTQRNLANIYPDIVKKAEQIMDTSYTIHPWYWNPNETAAEYKLKVQKAKDTNNVLPNNRPNDASKVNWK